MKENSPCWGGEKKSPCYRLMSEFSGVRLSREEFAKICREEFAFLVSQHGFVEETPPGAAMQRSIQMRFVGASTRVIIESRCYGSGIGVFLERLAGGSCGLVELLEDRDPEVAACLMELGDQDALICKAAAAMRSHGMEAALGVADAFREIGEPGRQKPEEQGESKLQCS
jgi:hypothetical protein